MRTSTGLIQALPCHETYARSGETCRHGIVITDSAVSEGPRSSIPPAQDRLRGEGVSGSGGEGVTRGDIFAREVRPVRREPMAREHLKRQICEAVDRRRGEIVEIGEDIMRNPE